MSTDLGQPTRRRAKFKSRNPRGWPAGSMLAGPVQLCGRCRVSSGRAPTDLQGQRLPDFPLQLLIFLEEQSSTFSVWDPSLASLWLTSPGPEPFQFNEPREQTSPS